MKNIIGFLCFLGFVAALALLLGTAGGIECNSITITTGAKEIIIGIVILICSVVGIIRLENEEEENVYDRL